MIIIVPSRGRPGQQLTGSQLTAAKIPYVQALTESDPLREQYRVPDIGSQRIFSSHNYSQKCQMLLEHYGVGSPEADSDGKFLKIDDDLQIKKVLEDGKTRDATAREFADLVHVVETLLDEYTIVSLADRFMIQAKTQPYEHDSRARAFVGINTSRFPAFRENWPRYDRLSTLQDIDFQFQCYDLLGANVAVVTSFCFVERSWSAGGCNVYRDTELNVANHHKLQQFWPNYVALKEAKPEMGGIKSVIQVKKAARELRSNFIQRNK